MPSLPYDQHPELTIEYKIKHYQGTQPVQFEVKIIHTNEYYYQTFNHQQDAWNKRRRGNIPDPSSTVVKK